MVAADPAAAAAAIDGGVGCVGDVERIRGCGRAVRAEFGPYQAGLLLSKL